MQLRLRRPTDCRHHSTYCAYGRLNSAKFPPLYLPGLRIPSSLRCFRLLPAISRPSALLCHRPSARPGPYAKRICHLPCSARGCEPMLLLHRSIRATEVRPLGVRRSSIQTRVVPRPRLRSPFLARFAPRCSMAATDLRSDRPGPQPADSTSERKNYRRTGTELGVFESGIVSRKPHFGSPLVRVELSALQLMIAFSDKV
jgi:hypothetical protein